jgi:hypothetical protein
MRYSEIITESDNANRSLLRLHDGLLEQGMTKQQFSSEQMTAAIQKCLQHFGEHALFFGNCAEFAIGLAKWTSHTFQTNSVSLAAPIILFENSPPPPYRLSQLIHGNDIAHVMIGFDAAGTKYLFDGYGQVTDSRLKDWFKQAWKLFGYEGPKKWERQYGNDPKPTRKVALAYGGIDDANAVAVVQAGTDSNAYTWDEFYEFLTPP